MQGMEISYSVPRDLLEKFAVEAQQNKCVNGGGHKETLAFITGHWLQNKLFAQDLISSCVLPSLNLMSGGISDLSL